MYSFLLFINREKKGGEDGGRAPVAWESVQRKTSVFTMSLSQSISLRDMALPLGRLLSGALQLESMIWFQVARFLGGEDHSKESNPPSI